MDTLLIIAIVVGTLSIVIQTGVLAGIFLMARRTQANLEKVTAYAVRMAGPIDEVVSHLKSATADISRVAAEAKDETGVLKSRINTSVDEIEKRVMTPIRECSAIAGGREKQRTIHRARHPPREARLQRALHSLKPHVLYFRVRAIRPGR